MTTFTSPRIDPRTGFIQFQLPLLYLVGNDHRGPALSLMLHYCPPQTQRSLYGQGFNDTLSYFNPESRQLQTADGEHFGLNQREGEWVFLPPSPLNIQLAPREDSLWLYYRSGVVEIMARSPQQPADDPLWRLQTRLSAGGNALFLRWKWRQNLALLTSVADNDGELMHASLRLTPPEVKNSGMGVNALTRCAVQTSVPSYRTSEAEIPNDADSNAQLSYTCFPASKAAVTTVLTLAGGKLVQLSCGPDGKRILCRIVYHPSLGVIQRVNLSGGVSESFSYAAGAVSPPYPIPYHHCQQRR
ncbi:MULTISPECIES: hypothetical protein [Enterobacterales]|uniref:Uncharacterized protein n=1 Tax=Candidatus Sodalis endolongispinus TaxID=2812662 RepID=A0ABS5YCE5_9GAMM|nr:MULTISPECIES: hypothetical protein [Enterobacterales]MBG6247515.1 hypothetical protein [Candidatus Symbiopectobacterium sp. PLON1]MBT9432606.1 hypothetical protein [Candidatus Sodalis endolongispinus]